jgi:DNA-directed RNA polymerase subunit M/transcription elongation factor TFIIS
MAKFCDNCDNLLISNFYNDELSFKCILCNSSYSPDDEDTLRYERIKESDVMIFEKNLNKAVKDPATLKAYVNCIMPKCSGKLVKQVRIGENMRLYNICIECGAQWLN